jgi:type IV secretory pathway TraG/TraD family ATPase VirD4
LGWLGSGSKPDNERLRGAELVTSKALASLVNRRAKKDKAGTFFNLAGVPIPARNEPLGFLLAGAPGSGKSQLMYQMFYQARQRGDRGVVFDLGGQGFERFGCEGDIILNPLDSRSVQWSPFAEIQNPTIDAIKLARSLIPDGQGSGAEWSTFAQQAVAAVFKALVREQRATTGDLLTALTAPLPDLAGMVEGTPAAQVLNPQAKGMAASVLGVIGAYADPLSILPQTTGSDGFSLRKWMAEGEPGSWIFLTVRDDQEALLRPLISCWLDILISALLSLQEDPTRRVIFGLDEFSSLPKINNMRALVEKGRKYGALPILGMQAISQPRSTYSRDDAQTILSCLGNWVVLRSPDADTADYMSKQLGDMQLKRVSESANHQKGKNNWSEHVGLEKIVLPAEIQNLQNLHGYLNLGGDFPIAKVEIDYIKWPIINQAFS